MIPSVYIVDNARDFVKAFDPRLIAIYGWDPEELHRRTVWS